MPRTTRVDIPPTEQAQMLAEVRRARYGYLLALHILLLCAAQRTPTEIAAVLFGSRSTASAGQWPVALCALGAVLHSRGNCGGRSATGSAHRTG